MVFKSISKASNVKTQSLKRSTFPLFMHSLALSTPIMLTIHKAFTVLSQNVHLRSPSVLSVHLSFSQILLYLSLWQYSHVVICYFFLITQCKNNSQVAPNKLFILHSPCLHCSLYACICTPFVLCVYSPFIGAHQILSILIFLRYGGFFLNIFHWKQILFLKGFLLPFFVRFKRNLYWLK